MNDSAERPVLFAVCYDSEDEHGIVICASEWDTRKQKAIIEQALHGTTTPLSMQRATPVRIARFVGDWITD